MSNDLQDLRAVSTVKDRLPWLPYLAAAVLSAVAIGVRYMVSGPDAVAGPVYIVLVLPIGLAAYFGGFGPGLLSTLLTTLGAEVVLLEPVGGLFGAPLRMRLGLLMLGVIGVLVSLAARQLYAARAIVAVDAHELEHAAALSERDRHLQHLQGQLEHIVATAPGVIYAFRRRADGTEGFTYASAGSARLLGVSFEEMERDTSALFAMMDPGDAEEGARKIDVSARDLTPWRHQFRLRRPDGEERWIEAHSIPSREADGETLWHGFMSDITARKSAERALDAARETMEILIEQSPVAIAMFDTSMTFLAASGRWCEQFGYETDELIGHSLYSVVPEIPERWRRLHADAIAGTSWQDDHDQWRLKDGKFHDVRWAIHPWRAETGAIGGVILFAEDVTEANAAARRLAASEQRYRDLVNMSPEAIFLTRDSKIVYANPAALAVLGAQALDDVLGRDAVEFLHPDERDHMQAAREHLQAGETLPPTQRRFVRLDGTAIQVEVVARPYQDAEGPAVQTVVHDITDRIRQEEALRETSTRFRQLAESIREAFYLADESRTRVRYLSAAAREIFGRAEDEFTAGIGTWRTIIHGADRERVTEVLQGVLQGHAFDLEYRIVRGDGTVRWVRDRASAVRDTRGTIVGIAGLVEDVTERRVLESQLQQASKVESVGLLAGGIAHDFNNLLTVINGNAELLEQLIEEQAERVPEALELVHEVRGAGERASALTRQLLAFSRKQAVEPRPVDVSAVVADTEKMLRRLLGSSVELRTELAPVHAARLDPAQLGQVLINLAVNARDAMPNGGRLTIQTGEEVAAPSSSWAAESRRVRLTVTDTGEGMPAEVLARVFEPFFTTKGIGRGTGLGLAVVQGIVKQSGGEISVQSTVGLGTRFTLTFPASEQRLDDLAAARAAVGGSETLLVVEDEPLVRRTSVRALRLAGYRVREAECAEDALRILEEPDEVIHLLLTDVMMPGMNGRELAERVQLTKPAMRVLLMSGFTDDAAVRQGIAERTLRLLPKPFSVQALLDAVRRTLDTALV